MSKWTESSAGVIISTSYQKEHSCFGPNFPTHVTQLSLSELYHGCFCAWWFLNIDFWRWTYKELLLYLCSRFQYQKTLENASCSENFLGNCKTVIYNCEASISWFMKRDQQHLLWRMDVWLTCDQGDKEPSILHWQAFILFDPPLVALPRFPFSKSLKPGSGGAILTPEKYWAWCMLWLWCH